MPRKDLYLISGIFIAVCAFYFGWSVYVTKPGFPLDDSWIHEVFARNIITGHGFSFNPGHPISGATAPLWTLILALFWPVLGPVASGLLLGIFLELLAIMAIYRITEFLTGQRALAALTAILTSLTWVLIWGALSGMEVGLYSASSLWGLYFYFRAESFYDKRNYLAYGLIGLALLSRPECALILAAMVIKDSLDWVRLPEKKLSAVLWRILPLAILLVPYIFFNISTVGSVFPQTFAAKERGRGLISGIIDGDLKRIITAFSILPYNYAQDFARGLLNLNPLLLAGSAAGILKFVSANDSMKSKRIMIVVLFLSYVPLMGALAPVISPTFQRMRTIANILPLFVMFGVAGLFWKEGAIDRTLSRLLLKIALLLVALGIVLAVAAGPIVSILGPGLIHDPGRTHDSAQRILLESFVRDTGLKSLLISVILLTGSVLAANWTRTIIEIAPGKALVKIAIIAYTVIILFVNVRLYSNDVKNINDVDVAAGLYLKEIASPQQTVAVNDIGAIGYFSEMRIFDLKGLVSPEITREMIYNDSLAFEYMRRQKKVDYMAIFPIWFNYIPTRTDIFRPLASFGTGWNTTLAGDTTVVYKAVWPSLSAEAGDSVN